MEHLDLTPWRCPEPLIRLKLWLREAKSGQTVTIRLADAGSRQDIPAYLQRQGHRFTVQQAQDNTLSLQLVVGAQHHHEPR
ncbi:sulfurtransferase TusA family protein [Aeromonas bestiarum]|uniref:Sulfurtransferase TusA family protein n=1 Tax=Aeromonas bestiarum TaxID=105751 RepID=A0AAW7I2S6_9GAMM|nr:sulfurtransferase TusA family protein [Aeromonas bestiarum]MDM5138533.1 sulfurtransferase TusA family protein [Aeromonas bestiarum]WDL81125.1 sulfurtransferase TusA family protein [Aeromonas bestiarum]